MASTELDWNEKLSVLNLLSGFVRQSELLQDELKEGRVPDQAQLESEREYGEPLPRHRDPDFIDGLELILDGLAARVAGAARTSSS